MLLDSFSDSQNLEPEEEIFDEQTIRDHLNGILKYKAPAILNMLNYVLGDQKNFIQVAAQNLVNRRYSSNSNVVK